MTAYALMTSSSNLSCSPDPVPTTTTSVPLAFDERESGRRRRVNDAIDSRRSRRGDSRGNIPDRRRLVRRFVQGGPWPWHRTTSPRFRTLGRDGASISDTASERGQETGRRDIRDLPRRRQRSARASPTRPRPCHISSLAGYARSDVARRRRS